MRREVLQNEGMQLSASDVKWVFEKLRKVDFLSYHSEEELVALIRSMKRMELRAGEPVIQQGQDGRAYYLLRRGSVAVWADTKEGRKPLATLGEGDSFGEVSVLTGEVCNASVSAETDVELFALPPGAVREVVRSNPVLAEKMARAVAERRGVRALGLEPAASHPGLMDRVKSFLHLPA